MTDIFDFPDFHLKLKTGVLPSADLFLSPYRERERQHIQTIFSQLSNKSYQHEIQKRLLIGDQSNHLGAWYELMVYDWLRQKGLNPIPVAKTDSGISRPDFLVNLNGIETYVEVACVQESQKDQPLLEKSAWYPAATATFETMRKRLIDKIGQHKFLDDKAYLVCLCLHSRRIGLSEVKTALLGEEAVRITTEEVVSLNNGEIFERHGSDLYVKYLRLSGVLVAKSNRSTLDAGYLLDFGYIQNPYADILIDPDTFGEIPCFVVVDVARDCLYMKWKLALTRED